MILLAAEHKAHGSRSPSEAAAVLHNCSVTASPGNEQPFP